MESERDEWRTPPWLFKYARVVLLGASDDVVYDAACNRTNALASPVHKRWGDALSVPWHGKVWCNPPYSNIPPWIEAAFKCDGPVVMLIPSPNGESYYPPLLEKAHEIHIVGRVGFINRHGQQVNGNPRGSSLFIINNGGTGTRTFMQREAIRNWNYKTSGYET